jgi:hypothetical protein
MIVSIFVCIIAAVVILIIDKRKSKLGYHLPN